MGDSVWVQAGVNSGYYSVSFTVCMENALKAEMAPKDEKALKDVKTPKDETSRRCFPLRNFPNGSYNALTNKYLEYDFNTEIVHGDRTASGDYDPDSPHGVMMVSFKRNDHFEVKALEAKRAAENRALCILYEMKSQDCNFNFMAHFHKTLDGNIRYMTGGDKSTLAHYVAASKIFQEANQGYEVSICEGLHRPSDPFEIHMIKPK